MVNIERILKHNTVALARSFAIHLIVCVVLITIPIILSKAAEWNSPFMGFFTVAGIVGLIFMGFRFPYAILWLRQCKKALRLYPLEFRPHLIQKGKSRNRYGTVFTLRIRDHQPGREPQMKAVNALERHTWPKGVEDGVWVAGDLPFGGVIVVPSNDCLMIMQPEKWDKLAPERDSADFDRVTRARQAGFAKLRIH
ncbi:hypothetical protein GTY65_36505 [Streptomyces sp. SID8379]|uniref:hypothetical protein n=1 Tax=unclassified Streptomyces TaxID=2593676 RepID=UPI00131A2C44|nr:MULTISPECIES: hypothetical protein [unclassified Streptomyces]MYW69529.1 hypothetical protein [Streptomyces sp. SID8379]